MEPLNTRWQLGLKGIILGWLKTRPRLSGRIRLWWYEGEMEKDYRVKSKEAKLSGDKQRLADLQDHYEWDLTLIADQRRYFYQQKAIRKAQRLGLHIPWREVEAIRAHREDENWHYGINGEWLLRDEAFTNLRREIRREQKETLELFSPWISLLIGLFGSVASVLAAWLAWLAWSSRGP